MRVEKIKCPDCGLVLRVRGDGPGLEFNYAVTEWKRCCKRRKLGDPVWCLLQRDGTSREEICAERGVAAGSVAVAAARQGSSRRS